MPKVTLTSNLQQYYPQNHVEITGDTLFQVLSNMDKIRPHFMSYILEDDHSIRTHVNIFIDGKIITDKSNTNIKLEAKTQIHIMQALSGG